MKKTERRVRILAVALFLGVLPFIGVPSYRKGFCNQPDELQKDFLASQVNTAVFHVQTDCDQDGLSDFASAVSSGTDLNWNCKGSTSDVDEFNVSFGLSTDYPVPGAWLGASSLNLGFIRVRRSNLFWKVLVDKSTVDQRKFGKAGDLVMGGADFNGDGIADAAVARFKETNLIWEVHYNLFTKKSKLRTFQLGKSGDRLFYFNPTGKSDQAAAFGPGENRASRIIYRDLTTGRVRKSRRFPRRLSKGSRPRPFPVADASGKDIIGFILEDGAETEMRFFTARGKKLVKHQFPGVGSVAVGDFNLDYDGEEVALKTSKKLFLYNPFSDTAVQAYGVTGSIIDEVTVVHAE